MYISLNNTKFKHKYVYINVYLSNRFLVYLHLHFSITHIGIDFTFILSSDVRCIFWYLFNLIESKFCYNPYIVSTRTKNIDIFRVHWDLGY